MKEERTSAEMEAARRPISHMSVVVCLALVAVAVAICVVTTSVVRDQERRLLHERTKEIGSALTNVITTGQSSLVLLAAVPARTGYSASKFTGAAHALLGSGVLTVGVARERSGRPVVVAAVGNGLAVGNTLTGDRAGVVRRALAAGMLTTELIHTRRGDRLSLAAPGPDGAVAYEETAIDPTKPSLTPGSPYSELEVIAYATPQAAGSELLGTNVSLSAPLTGFDRTVLRVGASRWLLLTKARGRSSVHLLRVSPGSSSGSASSPHCS